MRKKLLAAIQISVPLIVGAGKVPSFWNLQVTVSTDHLLFGQPEKILSWVVYSDNDKGEKWGSCWHRYTGWRRLCSELLLRLEAESVEEDGKTVLPVGFSKLGSPTWLPSPIRVFPLTLAGIEVCDPLLEKPKNRQIWRPRWKRREALKEPWNWRVVCCGQNWGERHLPRALLSLKKKIYKQSRRMVECRAETGSRVQIDMEGLMRNCNWVLNRGRSIVSYRPSPWVMPEVIRGLGFPKLSFTCYISGNCSDRAPLRRGSGRPSSVTASVVLILHGWAVIHGALPLPFFPL